MLESLIVNRDCPFMNTTDATSYISLFYLLIHRTFDSAGAVALKRLWLDIDVKNSNRYGGPFGEMLTVPSMESFCVNVSHLSVIDVNDPRYTRLQHYGDFELTRLDELPNLKYAAGRLSLSENIQVRRFIQILIVL